jgi:hypothetical protein
MNKLLVVLVLGAGAWFGYRHFAHKEQPAPGTAPTGFTPAPQGETPAAGSSEQPPPAAVKADLDAADALWKKLEDAGTPPATAKEAPRLDLLYSNVLKGLYNKPGQQALEKRLVETRLAPLGDALFFSRTRYTDDDTGLVAVYTVQQGEVLDTIAKKLGMSYQQLNKFRGKPEGDANLHAGDTFKVVNQKAKGGSFIHIDKGDFALDCFVGGAFARRYPIAIGEKSSPTPTGTTRIEEQVFHPKWTHPDTHEEIPYGDPRNILGDVWMRFAADGIGQTGIGIHGYTGADFQIGVQASHGCIRMDNKQVVELAYLVSIPARSPTAVEIVE